MHTIVTMKHTGRCPKCDGEDVAADVKAADEGHNGFVRDARLATFRNPAALLFKGKQESTVSAWVCLTCGYVEYYADTPDALRVR